MTGAVIDSNSNPSSVSSIEIFVAIAQRLICLAMLGVVAFIALIIVGSDDRLVATLCIAAALVPAVISVLAMPNAGKNLRRECRDLIIVSAVVLALMLPLMMSASLRGTLHHIKFTPAAGG